LAKYFALEAYQRFPDINDKSYHEIIPVPLYKTRKRERGYNQSEEIARALTRFSQIPVRSEHLLRIRPTSSQTTMSREVREQNVKNAFNCPVKIENSNILLIDDVITTGSTVDACAHVLKNSGAHAVDVFTIAHPSLTD
jgi:ComF family protein